MYLLIYTENTADNSANRVPPSVQWGGRWCFFINVCYLILHDCTDQPLCVWCAVLSSKQILPVKRCVRNRKQTPEVDLTSFNIKAHYCCTIHAAICAHNWTVYFEQKTGSCNVPVWFCVWLDLDRNQPKEFMKQLESRSHRQMTGTADFHRHIII